MLLHCGSVWCRNPAKNQCPYSVHLSAPHLVATPRPRQQCRADASEVGPSQPGPADQTDRDSAAKQSARDRLAKNPAYQRLSTWRDTFKPNPGGPATSRSRQPSSAPPQLIRDASERRQAGPASTSQPTAPARPAAPQHTTGRFDLAQLHQAQQSSQQPGPSRAQGLSRAPQPQQQGLAASQPGQPSRKLAAVRFWLNFHAQFGQRIRIVGSHEALGSWVLLSGAELAWSEGDMWNVVVDLPAGSVVEYKYVVLDNGGMHAIAWQRGNNSVLAVSHEDTQVDVYDNWEGSPGASVTSAGVTHTRENRLLSWANEIEAQVASQRGELRRSRLELMAAQDDARLAREEARKVRAELRASESERVKAERRLMELDTTNRLLRSQLSETTVSFRNAIETTHKFLLEAERNIASSRSDDEDEDEGYESGDEAEPLEAEAQSSLPEAQSPTEDASPASQDPGPPAAVAPSGLSMAEKNPAVELESGAGLVSDHQASIEERDRPEAENAAGEGEPKASNGASASTQHGDAGRLSEVNGQLPEVDSEADAEMQEVETAF